MELEAAFTGRDTSGEKPAMNPYIPDRPGLDTAYRNFVQELGSYLYDHGFEWSEKTRYFQRVYFEPDGGAAYYLYSFRNNAPKGERRSRFESLVEDFLASHSLKVDGKGRLALCAPVILKPKE